MPRPNDVSTSSAPSSWARRATAAAIESLVSTPVTTSFLPSRSISFRSLGSRSGSRVARCGSRRSQRDVVVAPGRQALALGGQRQQRGGDGAAGVGRFDDLVDVAAFGGRGGCEVDGLVLGLELGAPCVALLLGGRGRQLAAVQDLDRALGAHHRDLGGRRGGSCRATPGRGPVETRACRRA